jgi:hypothetical protein
MIIKKGIESNKEKLRSYSSVFSSTAFAKLLSENDYSFITNKVKRYDIDNLGKKFITYSDYVKYIYNQLQREYQCEYIYKNTLINELLLKKYGTKDTVVFNEFKVGKSVADLVLFNGISKAFEIKTELDSTKRLEGQLFHYTKIFKECYIVTHENMASKYESFTDKNIGIIAVKIQKNRMILDEIRQAIPNTDIDSDVLMRSIRTPEYKNIIENYYGYLPEMNSFDMFHKCHALMQKIPAEDLHSLFISELKKRKSNTNILCKFQKELRQLCLSLNISGAQYDNMESKLAIPIKL